MHTLRQFYLVMLGALFAVALLVHPEGGRSGIWYGALPDPVYAGVMGGYNPEGKIGLFGIALMSLVIRLFHRERWDVVPGHPLWPQRPISSALSYDIVLASIGVLSMTLLAGLLPRAEGGTILPNLFYLVVLVLLIGVVELILTVRETPPREQPPAPLEKERSNQRS